jgi:RNA polymerase sigma-70 factor (ECF subfamily)
MTTANSNPEQMQLAAQVEHVFRVAYRLTGNSHDAEDLVQDVCERALRNAPPFATAADCRRWLLRVLFNRFIDETRHRGRSPVAASFGVSGAAAVALAADPEELAERSDAELMLVRAWDRLEPVQQVLLMLRAEGHDLDEIARITDIDKPAISSRLHRARSSLARYLKQEQSI